MKAKGLIFLLVVVACFETFSQVRECGTMVALQYQLQKDTSLKAILDSNESAMQKYIDNSGKTESKSAYDLPNVSGVERTGNRKLDIENLIEFKEEMYALDPELYRELTRKSPSKVKTKID